MMALFDEWGRIMPITVLEIDKCKVVDHKTFEKDGFWAMIIGAFPVRLKHMKKPQMGLYAKHDIEPNKLVRQIYVTPDAMLPIGTELTCKHFVPGQRVDVKGRSKGKGFAGGMKRWGFKGGRASHGNSVSHRVIGSTGNRQVCR